MEFKTGDLVVQRSDYNEAGYLSVDEFTEEFGQGPFLVSKICSERYFYLVIPETKGKFYVSNTRFILFNKKKQEKKANIGLDGRPKRKIRNEHFHRL